MFSWDSCGVASDEGRWNGALESAPNRQPGKAAPRLEGLIQEQEPGDLVVGQTFLSAGSGDFPVCRRGERDWVRTLESVLTGRLESPPYGRQFSGPNATSLFRWKPVVNWLHEDE